MLEPRRSFNSSAKAPQARTAPRRLERVTARRWRHVCKNTCAAGVRAFRCFANSFLNACAFRHRRIRHWPMNSLASPRMVLLSSFTKFNVIFRESWPAIISSHRDCMPSETLSITHLFIAECKLRIVKRNRSIPAPAFHCGMRNSSPSVPFRHSGDSRHNQTCYFERSEKSP